jgi:hypothetical protein
VRYEQPYGISDPNASYINGNPTTGMMGSIPPALSIENPQREIVNFINDSGLVPTAADVRQLSKAVQGGIVNYCPDQGTPNFLAITPVPPISTYLLGQHFRIKVANKNTGPSQLNVNNLGWAQITHGDLTQMGGGELLPGQMIEVAWDGAGHWQMLTGGVSGSLINLTSTNVFYVNQATGNDSLYDGSQPTVDATNTHGPFKTLRYALGQTSKYNLAGFNFIIYMAPGVYPETSLMQAPIPNGSGTIVIQGRHADGTFTDPSAVKITNVGNGSTLHVVGGFYYFDGVSFESTHGIPADNGDALWISGSGGAWLNNTAFWNAASHHILVAAGGSLSVGGPVGIYGSGVSHMTASQNGNIGFFPAPLPTLNIYNPVSFTWFAAADTGGQMQAAYAAIYGYGNVTGTKYFATANGVINAFGRGESYLPGTTPGAATAGGQYV